MFDGSMSESKNRGAVNVRSRLFLALPLVLFAFVALTVGFVASKTLRQPYRTAFLQLLFSDPLHMKVWLVTAALLLALGQLLTASRIRTRISAGVFRQSIGMPPYRYVTMRRLAAVELIRKTLKPLAEVAIEVGFSDQSHFTRVFTQMTGETPGALRRRYR
jgi:AraC-like DNA-binding protein